MKKAQHFWNVALSSKSILLVALILSANLSITLVTNRLVIQDFKNSADDYAQYLMAEMFAEGKLSVPSPEPSGFFRLIHTLDDGRFYGKYSPGWPIILCVGVILGIPWLVNPLFGTLTLLLIRRTGSEVFSHEVGNLSFYLTAFNPFFIFNSASYYQHTTCLFFITLFLYAYFRALQGRGHIGSHITMGVACGMAFLIRQYTTVIIALPLALFMLYRATKANQIRVLLRYIPLSAGIVLAIVSFNLYYNNSLTGNPFLQPFSVYDPFDKPKILMSSHEFRSAVLNNGLYRILELNAWVPLSGFFVILFLYSRRLRSNPNGLLLVCVSVSLSVAYFFYWCDGGNRYGPRYLYECLGALALLMGIVIHDSSRIGSVMCASVILISILTFAGAAKYYSHEIQERREVYDLVQEAKLSNAIVFLRTGSGSMGPGELTRNGIHFDGSVLYVHDRGARNRRLLDMHPERTAYYYYYDKQLETGYLKPYTQYKR